MSPKSVAEKLLIKAGSSVWASDLARLSLLGPLPDGVRIVDRLEDAATVIVFAESAAALRGRLEPARDRLGASAAFWVAYPKANRADINRDSLWPILAEFGLRPISQVAIDDTWSALRFRALRAGALPFNGGG